MDLHTFLLVLFLFSLLSGNTGVEGGREFKSEDTELEEQLKFLNKPAVETIKTEYGDTYGCVDFYKQPAFDHPLLKNHSFHSQMKPTSLLKRNREQVSSKARESVDIKLKGGGCPLGTVPIRRVTKEDLIRERNASKLMSFSDNAFGPHVAILRTKPGPNKFNGAGAWLSIHNPRVSEVQYSASRVVLQNGNDVIRAGWRDLVNGNWWLLAGDHNTEVGFWPKRIFSGLADFASYAEWGGQVSGGPGPSPEMGTGLSRSEHSANYDAHAGNIAVMNEKGQTVDVYNTEPYSDKPTVYYVEEVKQTKLGHLFLYGGPSSVN
ncbi:hypothetical protein Vadar_022969 [Vaccinium darrowii]|uniref:Uncharacterized protein n=1 Tax=Vaccinium darrowii TaxID=229202 RepID=A0ACB7XKG5_9ERIC|nr:hypothetical protein Vadar_022969 [Vaccinium darrowii]